MDYPRIFSHVDRGKHHALAHGFSGVDDFLPFQYQPSITSRRRLTRLFPPRRPNCNFYRSNADRRKYRRHQHPVEPQQNRQNPRDAQFRHEFSIADGQTGHEAEIDAVQRIPALQVADDQAEQYDQQKQYGKNRPDNAQIEPDGFEEFSTDVRCMRGASCHGLPEVLPER